MTTLATRPEAEQALVNLADLHGLDAIHTVQVTNKAGHLVLHIALLEIHAEAWRAAIGAPAYTETRWTHHSTWRTSAMWMGTTTHLLYTTY